MPIAKEYRQKAQDCLELAKWATDVFSKEAMVELAEESYRTADELEHNRISPRRHVIYCSR
jgi:hypothetical protein